MIKYIISRGSISISEFMSIASVEPSNGYYTNKEDFTIDFTTAPEISNLFNITIAEQIIIDIELLIKNNKQIKLIELGPGSGKTMVKILNVLSKIKSFYDKVSIHMIEISEKLTKSQKINLKNHCHKISWHKNINEVEINCPFILICNEFFDTMPSNQFILIEGTLFERKLAFNQKLKTLQFIAQKSLSSMQIDPSKILKCPEGGIIEESTASKAILQDICFSLLKHGGVARIIDHGYICDTYKCTLKAIKKHKILNIESDDLSEADISIDVNFAALLDCAKKFVNCKLETQKEFLENSFFFQKNKNKLSKLEADFLLEKMGTKFKVIHLYSTSQKYRH